MTDGIRGIESRIYQAYWQDGSTDLVLGLVVFLSGLVWALGYFAAAIAFWAAATPAWLLLRQRIVEPRLGRVRFAPRRTGRLRIGFMGAIAVGLGVLALVVTLGWSPESARWMAPAIPSLIMGMMAAVLGAAAEVGRFGLYAGWFVLTGLVIAAMGGEPGVALLVGGLMPAGAGALMLRRFLKDFPPLSDGEAE